LVSVAPLVSIVTPTYNRRRFIPSLLKMVETQTYPRDRMEWIVYDDGQEEVQDLFEAERANLPTLRFIWSEEKMTLGEKRNRLNSEASGEIIVAMDDDDFYFPTRVQDVVTAFKENPGYNLVGASEVYMYFTDTKEIWKAGPYFIGHATNGTMAWTKEYASKHKYDETVAFAEEKSFLDNYKNPLVQLDSKRVMLVISHSDNTFDKTELRTKTNPLLVKTTLQMKEFIKDSDLYEFFHSL
jgi:glycosyltransferase involved in cell wall biosynthesis